MDPNNQSRQHGKARKNSKPEQHINTGPFHQEVGVQPKSADRSHMPSNQPHKQNKQPQERLPQESADQTQRGNEQQSHADASGHTTIQHHAHKDTQGQLQLYSQGEERIDPQGERNINSHQAGKSEVRNKQLETAGDIEHHQQREGCDVGNNQSTRSQDSKHLPESDTETHDVKDGLKQKAHKQEGDDGVDSTDIEEFFVVQKWQKNHSHCYSQEEVDEMRRNFEIIIKKQLAKQKKKHEQEIGRLTQVHQREKEDLSSRLSTEMNSKISSNETSIENISIKNRPSNIVEDYRNHCNTQWVEAKQFLDDIYETDPDLIKYQFLCNLLQFSEQVALKLQAESEKRIYQHIRDPLNRHADRDDVCSKHELALEVKNATSDILRLMADKVDVGPIVKGTQDRMMEANICKQNIFTSATILSYMETTAQLVWKMVNQRPVMKFHFGVIGQTICGSYQEPHWGSSEPKDPLSVVVCYVQPGLTHGDKLLVKDQVYLQRKVTGHD